MTEESDLIVSQKVSKLSILWSCLLCCEVWILALRSFVKSYEKKVMFPVVSFIVLYKVVAISPGNFSVRGFNPKIETFHSLQYYLGGYNL